MKHYHFTRLSLGWQIVIGLILGIIAGGIFFIIINQRSQ